MEEVTTMTKAEWDEIHNVTRVPYRRALLIEEEYLALRDRIPFASYADYKKDCNKNGTKPEKLPRVKVYCETPQCNYYCIDTWSGDLETTEVESPVDAIGWLEYEEEREP